MKIDENAPLIARKEILIDAPIEKVWELQADIPNWPTWQKDISSVQLKGKLEKGTQFTWRAMGMGITSTLGEVEKNSSIGWTGHSIGMDAIHLWKFRKEHEKTRVITEESLSGWFPRILKLFSPRFLENSLEKSLQALKTEAERR